MSYLLVLLVVFPLIGAVGLFPLTDKAAKPVALATSFVGVVLAIVLYFAFD